VRKQTMPKIPAQRCTRHVAFARVLSPMHHAPGPRSRLQRGLPGKPERQRLSL
jgi:hypothetical protein